MNKFTAPFAFAFLLILGFVILALILAWPTQWLWNECLVPAIDAVNPIGFWQAFGLNVLFSIIFNKNTINPKNKDK
jgi:hypothetical protein